MGNVDSYPPSPAQAISRYSRAAASLTGTAKRTKRTNNQLLALRSRSSTIAKPATLHAPFVSRQPTSTQTSVAFCALVSAAQQTRLQPQAVRRLIFFSRDFGNMLLSVFRTTHEWSPSVWLMAAIKRCIALAHRNHSRSPAEPPRAADIAMSAWQARWQNADRRSAYLALSVLPSSCLSPMAQQVPPAMPPSNSLKENGAPRSMVWPLGRSHRSQTFLRLRASNPSLFRQSTGITADLKVHMAAASRHSALEALVPWPPTVTCSGGYSYARQLVLS
jgi:hypothetical protein